MPKTSSLIKVLALVALVASAFYFFRITDRGRSITSESLLATIREYGPVAPLVYIGIYIVGTVVLLPGTVMSFAGAVLFGAYWGTLYTWIGAVIGSTLAFLVAKQLGRDFVDQMLGGKFDRFERRIRAHGFVGLLVVRLVPFFPYNGVNFGCGLINIRFTDYVLATAIGILPGTFVYQFLFANFGQRILADGLRLEYLADPQLLLALVLFASFILVGKVLSGRTTDDG